MTARRPHPLLDQLALLQQDVAVLRDWTALLDDAPHEFASSLGQLCAEKSSHASTHDIPAWPTERHALATRARRIREASGLTCAQLAHLTHVAASTIRNLERGRHTASKNTIQRLLPQLQQIERTLRALGTTPCPSNGDHSHDPLPHRP